MALVLDSFTNKVREFVRALFVFFMPNSETIFVPQQQEMALSTCSGLAWDDHYATPGLRINGHSHPALNGVSFLSLQQRQYRGSPCSVGLNQK